MVNQSTLNQGPAGAVFETDCSLILSPQKMYTAEDILEKKYKNMLKNYITLKVSGFKESSEATTV